MNKLLSVFSFLILVLVIEPAFAYIEIGEKGDAEATSGEQTTNLYRLNLQGMSAIKKLKKVDNIIARNEALGKKVMVYDVNDLLEKDVVQREKEELKIVLKEVNQIVATPKKLKITPDTETYIQLKNLHRNARDRTIAQQLMNSLKGRY